MVRTVIRWTLFALCLLVVGPMCWWLVSGLRLGDVRTVATPGVHQGTGGMAVGLLMGLLAVGIAGIASCLIARITSVRWGLFCGGVALAWAARSSDSLDALMRAGGEGVLMRLSIEAAVLGAGLLAVLAVLLPRGESPPLRTALSDRVTLTALGTGFAAALVAGFVAAYVVAQSMLRGQTLAAAVVAGLAAGAVSAVVSPRPEPLALLLGLVVLAVASPIIAGATSLPTGRLTMLANGATIFAGARVLPMDVLAGGLMGIPLGLAWGSSMVKTVPHGHAHHAPA
jgi:hypothetical protein